MTEPTLRAWETLTKRQFDEIDRAARGRLRHLLAAGGPRPPPAPGRRRPGGRGPGGALAALPARAPPGSDVPEAALRLRGDRPRPPARVAGVPAVDPGGGGGGPRPVACGPGLPHRLRLELPRQPAPLPGHRDGLPPRAPRHRPAHGLPLLGYADPTRRRGLGARRRARPRRRRRARATSPATPTAAWSRRASCSRSTRSWVDPDYKALPPRTVAMWIDEQGRRARRSRRHGSGGPPELVAHVKDALHYFVDESYSGMPSQATAELGRAVPRHPGRQGRRGRGRAARRQPAGRAVALALLGLRHVFVHRLAVAGVDRLLNKPRGVG